MDIKFDEYRGYRPGVKSLLKDSAVDRILKDRAALVAARLRSVTGSPVITEVRPTPNRDRVRLIVNEKGAARKRTNAIVSSLDAAKVGKKS